MRNKLKVIFIILISIALLGAVLVFGISTYIVIKTENKIYTFDEFGKKLESSPEQFADVDCILILGASVKPDGVPSNMLYDRIITGSKVYLIGASDKIIMSGDHGGEFYNEVGTMKKYAMMEGVPEDDIFMDHAGFSTYESIYRAKEIFGVNKMIIVTQDYHLHRAIYIANQFGIEAYGISSDIQHYYGQFKRDVREVLARDKDFIFCMLKPQPTYLGDKISLKDSGLITDDGSIVK